MLTSDEEKKPRLSWLSLFANATKLEMVHCLSVVTEVRVFYVLKAFQADLGAREQDSKIMS